MSFDRRWLFTAAGAAFLSSLFRKRGGGRRGTGHRGRHRWGRRPRTSSSPCIQKGWPRKLPRPRKTVARKALWEALREAIRQAVPQPHRSREGSPRGVRETLGTLTYACLENNRNGNLRVGA